MALRSPTPRLSQSTLRISLGDGGLVLLETALESSSQLSQLHLRFPLAERRSAAGIAMELGHFLSNVPALTMWRGPVEWSNAAAQTVRSVIEDSRYLDAVLDGQLPEPITNVGTITAESQGLWSGNLTGFQLDNVASLLLQHHGANFSVPGAGKTRTTLAVYSLLKARGHVDRLVVVAPKSAHTSWLDELSAVYETPPRVEIIASSLLAEAEVKILNYERLPSLKSALAASLHAHRTLLVLDEAHRMKRGAAGAYGAICLSIGPIASRRMVLSGTPAPNGEQDLQSLMEFVWPGRGASLVEATAISAPERFRRAYVRTTKRDLDLPRVNAVIRRVQLPPLHRRLYDALVGQFNVQVAANESIEDLGRVIVYLLMAATSPALLNVGSSRWEPLQFQVPPLDAPLGSRIRSLLGELPAHEISPKILEVVRIVKENSAVGKKTLVWSTFLRNAASLFEILNEYNPALVTGRSSDEQRADALQAFRSDPNCMVLISNPATLGEGVSLHQVCHDAVYLDRDFAAGRFLQSIDRIHRLGLRPDQETNVTILLAEDTIDDVVASRLETKLLYMDRVLDDPSLRQLADLEDDLEVGPVLDPSDRDAVWNYLGWPTTT